MWPTLVTPRSCNREVRQHGYQEEGSGQRLYRLAATNKFFQSLFRIQMRKISADEIGRNWHKRQSCRYPTCGSTKTAVMKDSQQTKNRGLTASGWRVAFCHLGTNQKQSPEDSSLRPHGPGLGYVECNGCRPHMHREGRMSSLTLLLGLRKPTLPSSLPMEHSRTHQPLEPRACQLNL